MDVENMRLIQAALVIPFTVAIATIANAQTGDEWLCTAEHSTGFAYMAGEWSGTKFRATDEYIIRPLTAEEAEDTFTQVMWPDSNYGVFRQGSKSAYFGCTESFSGVGYLYCGGHSGFFGFSKRNLRFTHSQKGHYVAVVPGLNDITNDSADTPFIEIGTCKKI
jgi:hypothetical protein